MFLQSNVEMLLFTFLSLRLCYIKQVLQEIRFAYIIN